MIPTVKKRLSIINRYSGRILTVGYIAVLKALVVVAKTVIIWLLDRIRRCKFYNTITVTIWIIQ